MVSNEKSAVIFSLVPLQLRFPSPHPIPWLLSKFCLSLSEYIIPRSRLFWYLYYLMISELPGYEVRFVLNFGKLSVIIMSNIYFIFSFFPPPDILITHMFHLLRLYHSCGLFLFFFNCLFSLHFSLGGFPGLIVKLTEVCLSQVLSTNESIRGILHFYQCVSDYQIFLLIFTFSMSLLTFPVCF